MRAPVDGRAHTLQDRTNAGKLEWLQSLCNDGGAGFRILLNGSQQVLLNGAGVVRFCNGSKPFPRAEELTNAGGNWKKEQDTQHDAVADPWSVISHARKVAICPSSSLSSLFYGCRETIDFAEAIRQQNQSGRRVRRPFGRARNLAALR
jgi:hypothetical protein